ncbi:MAG TPA: HigA family addiction module antitoxin [Devosia sp.]|jgi:addiction module HigA family antidote|uniref:HigA family addiction module antitoxin n=1 Tax=Devosia sp. TaxID=1871048 RepID=UPI002DDD94D8|nr:HigA family addiction module antitoxin [Devosia sp.]HEV2518009.1 HigA family addiction module antitoxin [Devosia sp.]
MATFVTPVHPGEILREEFMAELGLSAGALAKAIEVPRTRIERIVAEEVGISTDTAFRLARYFGTSPDVWLNLQQSYEVSVAAKSMKPALQRITPRADDVPADWLLA